MKRPMLVLALVAALGGCSGGDDTPESCQYDALKALDEGKFDRAIDLLSNNSDCADVFTDQELRMNLAAAYVGKAGYDALDVLDVLLEDTSDDSDSGDRLIRQLSAMASGRDSMTFLDQAVSQYRGMITGFAGGLTEACATGNIGQLTGLQRDACFQSGLIAAVNSANSVSLLLEDDLNAWLGSTGLACDNDRNQDQIADQGEITACAITAAGNLDGSTTCRAASGSAAAVTWQRLAASFDPVIFFNNGTEVGRFTPLLVRVDAAAACAEGAKDAYRLIQNDGTRNSVALTSGFCASANINQSCDASDPSSDCWPCPVLQASGSGALTATGSMVTALNDDSAALISTLPADQQADAEQELDELREDICNEVAGTSNACTTTNGVLQINESALSEYLSREGN